MTLPVYSKSIFCGQVPVGATELINNPPGSGLVYLVKKISVCNQSDLPAKVIVQHFSPGGNAAIIDEVLGIVPPDLAIKYYVSILLNEVLEADNSGLEVTWGSGGAPFLDVSVQGFALTLP